MTQALGTSSALPTFRDRVFRAVWEDQRDVSDEAVLSDLLTGLVDAPEEAVERARAPEHRNEVERQTCAAFERGVFGTPTMRWGGDIFFGSDRLSVLEWRYTGLRRSHERK